MRGSDILGFEKKKAKIKAEDKERSGRRRWRKNLLRA